MSAHDVSVIVVSHDNRPWLEAALGSLLEHAGGLSVEVVLVDNGSDGSADFAEERFEQVRAIRCPNRGFAHANNRGLGAADGRFVLLLNPDTEVVEGGLGELVDYMEDHPGTGLLGCRQVDEAGRLLPTARSFPSVWRAFGEALAPDRMPFKARWLGESELDLSRYEEDFACDWVSGSFLFMRREALDSVGLLDERFFFYSEEVDLCRRVKLAGWQIRHTPLLTIAHFGGSTNHSPRMEAQMAFARRQYSAKHFGRLRHAAFVAALSLRYLSRWAAFSVLPGGGRRALAQRSALLTLLGRSAPPFGAPPARALESR